MKKNVALLLILCLCFSLAACGASAASKAPAAETPAAADPAPAELAAVSVPAPTEEPAPQTVDLQPLVDSLNAEEVAQRTEEDPSIGIFELRAEDNAIIYKFAMHIFQYVIMMAQIGDTENLNAYNRLIDSLPPLEDSLESALRESEPDLNVVVMLMSDESSSEVAAVVEEGEIVYDLVNGVGVKPEGVKPIVDLQELSPEIQQQIQETLGSLTETE